MCVLGNAELCVCVSYTEGKGLEEYSQTTEGNIKRQERDGKVARKEFILCFILNTVVQFFKDEHFNLVIF